MKIYPFTLERWLSENMADYDLGSGGITKIDLGDLESRIPSSLKLAYGSTRGEEKIRSLVATLYNNVESENVLITNGAAEANFLATYLIIEKGDDIIVPLPNYLQVVGLAKSIGARVIFYRLNWKENFQFSADKLNKQMTEKTKLIYLTNPNNPTGTVLSKEMLFDICEIASTQGAYVICDGALRGSEINGELASADVSCYEKGIATGSISKVGLAGLRIGWLVASVDIVNKCWTLKDHTTLSHSGVSEYLADMALEGEAIKRLFERARNIVRNRIDLVEEWIRDHRNLLSWTKPEAGHTSFPRLTFDYDTKALSEELLQTESVLITPGEFLGCPEHIRLRHSIETKTLIEALERLSRFLRQMRT